MSEAARPTSYREFWPHYAAQHRRPGTRALHFIGTTAALLAIPAAALLGAWWPLPLGVGLAYGLAWLGHFRIERNRPATFRHPLWSAIGDFHMYGLMWRGRMGAECARLAAARQGDAGGE